MTDTIHFTQASDVSKWLPARKNALGINKATYGHSLIIGGSKGMIGAAVLAAEAAARSGSGLVTLAFPKSLELQILARLSPAIMTFALEDFTSDSIALTAKVNAVGLGPGLGLSHDMIRFVREFVPTCPLPLLVDADALNALSQETDHGAVIVRKRNRETVLTPHPKELARLLGVDVEIVQSDRSASVRKAAELFQCVVLLKGENTLICGANGELYQNSTGNPGMATAGSGDVLTGIITGLIAQNLTPIHAAAAGAFLHGLAGDLTAQHHGGFTGIIATDLIAALPRAIAHCQIMH